MQDAAAQLATFPRDLASYSTAVGQPLLDVLWARLREEPFNGIATGVFALAVLHTFLAGWFTTLSHRVRQRHDEQARRRGGEPLPNVAAELLHFLGEVEVVFGLWSVVLLSAMAVWFGVPVARRYVNETVVFTEALFVVVVMAVASTRPVVLFAERFLRSIARGGGGTPAAWWTTILIAGPLLGSLVTEPAAMTICALLLGRRFFDLTPGTRLQYATLGLLFVNVSLGGTVSHFAAPPVLMVSRVWDWNSWYMLEHFGWRSLAAILISTLVYRVVFWRELRGLAEHPDVLDVEAPDEEAGTATPLAAPGWVTAAHLGFLAWTVMNAHYPVLFISGFLFFLGFARTTAPYQSRLELRTPLLVGFFLAGLVVHGGLQGWWIAPVLDSLGHSSLFTGAVVLTAFNDNALITYLATLVPDLSEELKRAVVSGAVIGGGLTVIANAPNPAGQALLRRFFPDGAILPLGLAAGALVPTLISAAVFRLL
jgi:hypothetical protein